MPRAGRFRSAGVLFVAPQPLQKFKPRVPEPHLLSKPYCKALIPKTGRPDEPKGVCPMSLKTSSLNSGSALVGGFLAALVALSLVSPAAMAGNDKPQTVKPHRVHPAHAVQHHRYAVHREAYSGYRGRQFAHPAMLPYGPEYGFLTSVPPNAIRMPGYTFVPGVGILGESCDLPTSACDNRYRDVH
jgi:hypothetical protein